MIPTLTTLFKLSTCASDERFLAQHYIGAIVPIRRYTYEIVAQPSKIDDRHWLVAAKLWGRVHAGSASLQAD